MSTKTYKMINVRMPTVIFDEIKRRQAIANSNLPNAFAGERKHPTSLSDVVNYLLRSQLSLLSASERIELEQRPAVVWADDGNTYMETPGNA